jgi:hypothetical protein
VGDTWGLLRVPIHRIGRLCLTRKRDQKRFASAPTDESQVATTDVGGGEQAVVINDSLVDKR